jgi:hypothetical protein
MKLLRSLALAEGTSPLLAWRRLSAKKKGRGLGCWQPAARDGAIKRLEALSALRQGKLKFLSKSV